MSLMSRITCWFDWTPVGKLVEIKVEESAVPALLGKRFLGQIAFLNKDGSATLKLTGAIKQGGNDVHILIAHPKHAGYDFYHISTGVIAAHLSSNVAETGNGADTRFATCLIKRI